MAEVISTYIPPSFYEVSISKAFVYRKVKKNRAWKYLRISFPNPSHVYVMINTWKSVFKNVIWCFFSQDEVVKRNRLLPFKGSSSKFFSIKPFHIKNCQHAEKNVWEVLRENHIWKNLNDDKHKLEMEYFYDSYLLCDGQQKEIFISLNVKMLQPFILLRTYIVSFRPLQWKNWVARFEWIIAS